MIAMAAQQASETCVMEIPLTRGLIALVDAEDYERVVSVKGWRASPDRRGFKTYVIANVYLGNYRQRMVYLHRLILGVAPDMDVDHVNGDTLNNCRHNLRPATPQENARNRKCVGAIPFKGVVAQDGRYRARIVISGRRISLGMFSQEQDAARAYDAAARKYFGEFARLNFPDHVSDLGVSSQAHAGELCSVRLATSPSSLSNCSPAAHHVPDIAVERVPCPYPVRGVADE